jgi:hypothetical protein
LQEKIATQPNRYAEGHIPLEGGSPMKREIPMWAVVAVIALVAILAGWWLWSSTGRSANDQVVPKTFGSEAQRAPGAAGGTAQGADAP